MENKRMKKSMKISTEDNMAMGKNRKKKIYRSHIYVKWKGMNEVIIESQTYLFFPITELIDPQRTVWCSKGGWVRQLLFFFKFVCWFGHEP